MKMTNEQRRSIYGIASEIGIYEKGNPNDNLHSLVSNLTGKDSIGDLTLTEANQVISELRRLKGGQVKPGKQQKESGKEHRPGMITPEQRNKVWYFMYKLAEYDQEPSKVSLGSRLCKIIEKHLSITAFEKDPFRFLTFDQGSTLIEVMKKMVLYEERKRKKRAAEK